MPIINLERKLQKTANAVIFIRLTYNSSKITLASWGVLEADSEEIRFEE